MSEVYEVTLILKEYERGMEKNDVSNCNKSKYNTEQLINYIEKVCTEN